MLYSVIWVWLSNRVCMSRKLFFCFFLPRCRDGSRVHNLIIANFMPSIVRLSFCELFVFVAVRSVFRHIGVCNRLGPCVGKILFFCSFCKLRTEFLFVVFLWMHCVRECLCSIELYGCGDPVRFVRWENQTFLISYSQKFLGYLEAL